MGPTPLSFGPRGRFFVLLCFVFQGVEANSKAELAVKGVETFESPVLTFLLRTHALDLGQVSFHSGLWASGASVQQGYLGKL